MDEKIDTLLSRYFSGEASESELRQLDEWLAESKENEAYFEEMTMIYQYTGSTQQMPEPDVEKAFSAFQQHMQKDEKPLVTQKTLIRRLAPYISVAASFALLIGIAAFVINIDRKNHINLTASTTDIQQHIYNGVEISLSEGAELTYNPKNKKDITLTKGTVTFNVQSEDEEKLKVKVGRAIIEDIGTVFTVIANSPDDSIIVEVTEGEVLFYTKNNEGINIKESQKGVYYPDSNDFKLIPAALEKIESIEFRSTPLVKVAEKLSELYSVKITVASEDLQQIPMSFRIKPAETTIDNILENMSETLSIHVDQESENTYVLHH